MPYQIWIQVIESDVHGKEIDIGNPKMVAQFSSPSEAGEAIVIAHRAVGAFALVASLRSDET